MTVADVVRWGLALVLLGAAASKLAGGAEARAALASFGLAGARGRMAAWGGAIVAETGVAVALALGVPGAPFVAGALLSLFAAALATALARGRGGAPCGCFGPRSRISRQSVVRAAALAAVGLSLPFLPDGHVSTQAWLVAGLAVALAGVGALAVAVLALAREVGELRLSVAPQWALSIDGEGPEPGARLAIAGRFAAGAELLVAVFSSASCRVCEALEPALRLVAGEPGVALEVFDEQRDADVWRELAIPGSPFGVVMDSGGAVLSTGTFNTLAQLEGLLAAAERERVHA